jgi:hypothetical protein
VIDLGQQYCFQRAFGSQAYLMIFLGHIPLFWKSPFDVPHLLPKSIFHPSRAKPDISGPSTIESDYFWPATVLEGGFRMTLPQLGI